MENRISRRRRYAIALGWLMFVSACSPPRPTPQSPSAFVEGVWNPEDLGVIPGTSWAVVSAMRSFDHPGGLRLFDTAHPGAALPLFPTSGTRFRGIDPHAFAPHGIDVYRRSHERIELLVVDHGGGEAIDRFRLSLDARGAPYIQDIQRIPLPTGTSANGVAALPGGGFAITSMFDPRDPSYLAKFEAGEATGRAWLWSETGGWQPLGPPMSGANGIAVSQDGRTVYVAEWAARRLWRLSLDGGKPRSVDIDFLPDNLHWTGQGDLLLAGQRAEPAQVFACLPPKRSGCRRGYAIARVDPASLRTVPLIVEDHPAKDDFGLATGAVQTGAQLWAGSAIGGRVARFDLPARQTR